MPKATMLTAEEWRVAVDELASAARSNATAPADPAWPSAEPALPVSAPTEFTVRRDQPAAGPDPPEVSRPLPKADLGLTTVCQTCAALAMDITTRPGLFLLVDGAELDKTEPLIGLARDLRMAGHVASIVPGDGLTMEDLLLHLSLRLGTPPPGPGGAADWLAQFRKTASVAASRLIVVIIADAERLTDDVLIEFARLLPAAADEPGPLRLILTGRTLLADRLSGSALQAVRAAVVSERRLTRLPGGDVVAREMLRIAPQPVSLAAPQQPAATVAVRRGAHRGRDRCIAAAAAGAVLVLPLSLDSWIGAGDAARRQGSSVELSLPLAAPPATPDRVAADAAAPAGSEADSADAVTSSTALAALAPAAGAAAEAAASTTDDATAAPPAVTAPEPPPPEAPVSAPAAVVLATATAEPERAPDKAPLDVAAEDGRGTGEAEPAAPAADREIAAATVEDAVPEPLAEASAQAAETPPAPALPAASDQAAETVAVAGTAATAPTDPLPESPAALPEPAIVAAPPPEPPVQLAQAATPAPLTPAPQSVVAVPEPPPAAAPAPAPAPAAHAVAVERLPETVIAGLVKRGDELLEIKDISAARLCYERAAMAGNAHAAMLAGKTYDPAFFREVGVGGIAPDAAKAAQWYRNAMDLGDAEAATRMQGLPVQFRK